MMAAMCKKAGVTGYMTNHSLRATTASHLYHAGLDEQLIMERTGHRSIEGIRSYKRTSNEQQLQVSSLLNTHVVLDSVTAMTNSELHNPRPNELDLPMSASGIQLKNCTGVSITINNYDRNGPIN